MITKNDVNKLVASGIITEQQGNDIAILVEKDADSAIEFADGHESQKHSFSIAKTLYYLGGFLIIFSISYFLGNNWESLGNFGRILTTSLLVVIFGYSGMKLKCTQYKTVGSMLLLAAMVAVPLFIHSVERAIGLWPTASYGLNDLSYENFLGLVNTAWIALDIITLAIAVWAFSKFKDPILSLPVAHFFWFLMLDATNAIVGSHTFDMETLTLKAFVSLIAGSLLVAWGIYYNKKQDDSVGVWPWVYGLAIVLGSLIDLRFVQGNYKLLFQILILAFGVGALLVATPLKSRTFLTFGSIGIFWFIQDLVWSYFTDSLGFSVALLLSGLLTIGFGVMTQRYYKNNFTPRSDLDWNA